MILNFEYIGATLKKYRALRGISQEKLGELLGISRVAYTNLENGKSTLNLAQFAALVNHLKIPLVEAVGSPHDEDEIIALTRELHKTLGERLALHENKNGG